MWAERWERLALADRAAGRVDEEQRPVTPALYLQQFDEWLVHDPADNPDAAAERRARELLEA